MSDTQPERHKRGFYASKYAAIPPGDPQELTIFQFYRVTLRNIRKLRDLKVKLGFRSLDGVIGFLVNTVEREGVIPLATYTMAFKKAGTRPVIITGESGSGKTTTIRSLLSTFFQERDDALDMNSRQAPRNCFIMDVGDEYTDYRKVDLGHFFSIKWEQASGERLRFVPNPNVQISQAEAATIFSHLNFVKNAGALRNWVIVVEEAHRFKRDPNLRALLIEARKFTRKLIIVTTDWKIYQDITMVLKPAPFTEETARE